MMDQWKESHRGIAFPWNTDNYGHMNVRFFVEHFDDSSFQSWNALGISRNLMTDAGVEAVTARNTVQFFQEVSAGDLFTIKCAITRVGNKSVTFSHRMESSVTGDIYATMDTVEVIFDLKTRKSATMPLALRDSLNGIADTATHSKNEPSDAGSGRGNADWHTTHRGIVMPWRCDHYGHMNVRWYSHHFDDAGFHLFEMAGVDVSDLLQQNVALVTAQIQVNYLNELTAGDLFYIDSGFSHIGSKSARHFHRLKNAKSNHLHATMESIDVLFNMDTRKSINIPDELKEALSRNLVNIDA